MFPETYSYKRYDAYSSTAEYAIRAAIDLYTGSPTLETPPTYSETGVIYGQQGLKQI